MIYEITNLKGFILGSEPPNVEEFDFKNNRPIEIGEHQGGQRSPKYILFVHGADYSSIKEVIDEFITPLVTHSLRADLLQSPQTHFLFCYWDSKIQVPSSLRQNANSNQSVSSWLSSPSAFFKSLLHWKNCIKGIEEKALNSAKHATEIASFILNTHRDTTIISHSMGSVFIATILENLFRDKNMSPINIPQWINLQPAFAAKDFSTNAKFKHVAAAYKSNQSKFRLLFSRLDLVLILFSILGFRKITAGLIGLKDLSTRCKDVTFQVYEAHGSISIAAASGCYFKRIGPILNEEFKALEIFI